MSGRQGQTLQTWLMMVPLCVVPLIAVFGVPKFDLLTTPNADGQEPDLELELGEGTSLSESLPPIPNDQIQNTLPARSTESFSSSSSDETSVASGADGNWNDPFDPASGQVGHSTENMAPRPPGNDGAAFVDPFKTWGSASSEQASTETAGEPIGYKRSTEPDSEPMSETLSRQSTETAMMLHWREAVSKLNQLGVQKFELSQAKEPNVYRFACDLTSPENPRVAHRFQAEATDPLQAVSNVIQQVETWTVQHKLP